MIIDGFHNQAQVYDSKGSLAVQGLGLYVDSEGTSGRRSVSGTVASSGRTRLTAGLPLAYMGDPARGDRQFYVLIGLSDSRNPSMMLQSGADRRPGAFCAALTPVQPATGGTGLCLRPLAVRNPV